MNRISILFRSASSLLLCLGAFLQVVAANSSTKPKIAVMSIKGDPSSLDAEMTRQSEAVLSGIGRWTIVDRNSLDLLAKEAAFQNSGATSSQIELGKLSGAAFILTGNYTATSTYTPSKCEHGSCTDPFYTSSIQMNFKIIDIASGEIANACNAIVGTASNPGKDAATQGAVLNLMYGFQAKIREFYPAESQGIGLQIIKKEGNRVWIRGGSAIGIRPGFLFQAYTQGEIVKDPITGEVLTATAKATGKIKVVEVYEKAAVARILEGVHSIDSGNQLKELPHEGERYSYRYVALHADLAQKSATPNPHYTNKAVDQFVGGGAHLGVRQVGNGFGAEFGFTYMPQSKISWTQFQLQGRYTIYLIKEYLYLAANLGIQADRFGSQKEADFTSALIYKDRASYSKDSANGRVQTMATAYDEPSSVNAGFMGGGAVGLELGSTFAIEYRASFQIVQTSEFTADESSTDNSAVKEDRKEIRIQPDFNRYNVPGGFSIKHTVSLEYRF